MGQQQLILLVLATVIVGIAIVVGIRAFTENDAKANADAMMQDAVRVANDIQAWTRKAEPFGGAAAGETYTDAAWVDLGYVDDGAGNYVNLNGTFTLGDSGTDGALIQGTAFEDDGATARNQVQVTVCGPRDTDVNGAITVLNGAATGATPTACP
ncbi:MAG: hypothetical protein R3181_06895 [Rubricoccaceae bacterium]|nr:hypothetical protein [Rubricoccaceae bacterium]